MNPGKIKSFSTVIFALILSTNPSLRSYAQSSANMTPATPQATALLKPDDLKTLLPPSVFFKGQSAPLQQRNSAGIHFADGTYTLVALVDTSGYSSGVQERYQAYLITEVPLLFGTKHLPAGAYGVGFLADHTFLVMDIGGHDLLSTPASHDEEVKHPTPLRIVTDSSPDSYRFYAGRNYVSFHR